jgi:leader peptidase (prepilin peptidase)/N-methyltransferase
MDGTALHLLSQSRSGLWLLQHLPPAVFVFCFGACVGSFINVVNFRLPAGRSVISPPSRCPTCGANLRFFRENVPILGWFMVRGRCRYCKVRISPEYMIIEVIMALLFLGLYAVLYLVKPSTPWFGEIGGSWWYWNGFIRTWPAFFALAFLVAGLVSMTIIDARTFTIPIQIPLFITGAALVFWSVQALLPMRRVASMSWPIHCVGWTGCAMAFGGMIGTILAVILLRRGVFKYSFADYHEYVEEDQAIGEYPHARREMKHELLFLLPCIAGLVIGFFVGRSIGGAAPPTIVQALGASLAGYLVGGGLVWGVRILGTLGFGREAMGLGDVHLLGAIGAVVGWLDPILIFFIAPFSGLLWVAASMGLGTVFRALKRELPYGPHLALATIVVILCRPGIERARHSWLPTVDPPPRALVTSPPVP